MSPQNPRTLAISEFTYDLPEDRIALFPLAVRDQSRLLIFDQGKISENIYRHLATYLPADSMLVMNNTQVIAARLLFRKPTGGQIEVFLLEPVGKSGGMEAAMNTRGSVEWKSLIGGAGKWKHGQILSMEKHSDLFTLELRAGIAARDASSFIVNFSWSPASLRFSEVLHLAGSIPIPPYLKRNSESSDDERYQTVYASREGSVAAPTAGLHFTAELLASLAAKNIQSSFLTLHVGAGTFLPVKSAEMGGHLMHSEYIDVDRETIETLLNNAGKIFAVGTTSLRTLESIYWMGVKASMDPSISIEKMKIGQWEVYEELAGSAIEVPLALEALLNWMEKKGLSRLMTKTEILIAPPYRPKMIQGLITNFHQPDSTLLLLVAAVIGKDWKKVYQYALDQNFRFLSYGDGCLLFTKPVE